MARILGWLLLAGLLFQVNPAHSGPVQGPYREAYRNNEKKVRLDPGRPYRFTDVFLVNQRACVLVEGDHDPKMNLSVRVVDRSGAVVAEDRAGGDFVFVTWYPPRTQAYQIEISSDGTVYNQLEVVVK